MGMLASFPRRRFTIGLLSALGFLRQFLIPRGAAAASPGAPWPAAGQIQQPSRPMPQSPAERSAPFRTDWPAWLAGAKRGTRTAVTQWAALARLTGVQVNGPTAAGGRLIGPDLGGPIHLAMREAGMPDDAARRFGRGVNAAWKAWADTVQVGGMPWYPAFAAFPGPVAPPTPNVPCPLVALTQATGRMSPGTVAMQIKSALGPASAWPGASAIDGWASEFSAAFLRWTPICMVRNVLGTGPVPTFAPPYVPVGPVVGGVANQTPGGMACPFPWP